MRTTDTGWHPPHCPNPNCKYHNEIHPDWSYRKHGFYTRRIKPHRIQRFTCHHCGRYFSTQTFDVTYWLKRPDVLRRLMTKTTGGMANRQIATDLMAGSTTVDRQLSNLGRHCMLFHAQLIQDCEPPDEIAIDGFETYELSQYYPFNFHIAIEPESSFFPHFTDSELRRKGRMTEAQKMRREQLEQLHGRPDPKAVERDVGELLSTVLNGAHKATVRSDLHKAYPRAIRKLDCEVEHKTVSSKTHRDRSNLLWEINRTDRMIRHSQAGHVRETLAWPKRRQGAAERLGVFLVWWNYVRSRWVKHGCRSPGMIKGITDRLLTVDDVLEKRIFRTKVKLSERWAQYYEAGIVTRALKRCRRHDLKYAF